jgi:hypothetical protein
LADDGVAVFVIIGTLAAFFAAIAGGMLVTMLSGMLRCVGVPSVIAPLNWIERRDGGPRSGRFQNPELDDASGQETAAARVCWKGSATA